MDDPAEQRRRLAIHRARIVARSDRLTRLLHVVGRMTDGKDPIMTNTVSDPTAATSVELDAGDPPPARGRSLQLDLDADREAGPDTGRDRRDGPPRPRVALALGPSRTARQPRPRRVAVLAGVLDARARGARPVARPALRGDQRGDRRGRPAASRGTSPAPTRRWRGRRSRAATPPAARSGRRRRSTRSRRSTTPTTGCRSSRTSRRCRADAPSAGPRLAAVRWRGIGCTKQRRNQSPIVGWRGRNRVTRPSSGSFSPRSERRMHQVRQRRPSMHPGTV